MWEAVKSVGKLVAVVAVATGVQTFVASSIKNFLDKGEKKVVSKVKSSKKS